MSDTLTVIPDLVRRWSPLAARQGTPSGSGGPWSLVERLAAEMADAWERGDRCLAEDLLDRHPELAGNREAVLRLIYQEIGLRRDRGDVRVSAEVAQRFPGFEAELAALLACERDIGLVPGSTALPRVGERLGDFRLLAELGRGAVGRTFLASQSELADRPVVLKVTVRGHDEHLTLARLQHTHITPLYAVYHFPERNLIALCMPYVGGASWDRVHEMLAQEDPSAHTGSKILAVLDRLQAGPLMAPLALAQAPARRFLARASYEHAVCWLGACLADGLQDAHDHGLVHMDVKPSNVLLAADGRPMLLDFHLAREPIAAGGSAPEWLGGTRGWMSPEQEQAMLALGHRVSVPTVVDGRSDIYSLGLLLYHALGGEVQAQFPSAPPRFERWGEGVGTALVDLIRKCLAPDPADRYADAAALATDLRRHLAEQPLLGVANRSLAERWRKWRRRRPQGLMVLQIAGIALAILVAVGSLATSDLTRRARQAGAALTAGRQHLSRREYQAAIRVLTRGSALAEGLPASGGLKYDLRIELGRARRVEVARDLHVLADRARFLLAAGSASAARWRDLDRAFRAAWAVRDRIADDRGSPLEPELKAQVRADLLDLALIWADWRGTLNKAARSEAQHVLAQAKSLLGTAPAPASECLVAGRTALLAGDLRLASSKLEHVLEREPQNIWANLYQGMCAFRLGHHDDALAAFRVCVALAPESAECYYNRAAALEALYRPEEALRDYDHALRLDPSLAEAALNRGRLHFRAGRLDLAEADFRRALNRGAPQTAVHYDLALCGLARGDRPAALDSVRRALRADLQFQPARDLEARLKPGKGALP